MAADYQCVECPDCDRSFRNDKGYHIHYSTVHGPPYPWDSEAAYGQRWEAIREEAVERDGYACLACGDGPTEERFVELHVHHVDGDKKNHEMENLRTLCERCHLRHHLHGHVLILDRLQEGRASPTYIADRDNYSRQNVTNRLQRLVEHGYVQRLAPGLYELVEDPRGDQ